MSYRVKGLGARKCGQARAIGRSERPRLFDAGRLGSSVALLDLAEDVDDARSFIRLRQRGLLDTHFARR